MLSTLDFEARLTDLLARGDVAAAADYLRQADQTTLATQIELSEIAAPPFAEAARARRMAELFAEAGLVAVRTDVVGNVIADRAGTESGLDPSPLIVSAHLDTVFPEGTDVSVTRSGDLIRGPGISDDARGLAALLGLARALGSADIATARPIRFVATVGEEGSGDLRGVKHLFTTEGAAHGAAAFISLDGAGLERIVVRALGSRRYRVTVRGPGGHSWVDWGTANPIHALTQLAAALTNLPLPTDPQTTLTIARIGGGKSINAIPQEAWLEIDTRSSATVHLDELTRAVREAAATVEGDLDCTVEVIGSRPGGETAETEPLVQSAVAATRRIPRTPQLSLSSTDANIPMSLGTPAVTLGCGGEAGQAHTTDEWYRNVHGPEGIIRALHTVLLFVGVA